MNEYLVATLDKLRTKNYANVNIVIGNESCDLDSSVSAIVYACFLYWQSKQIKCNESMNVNRDEQTKYDIFIPILNVNREDFALKTEVTYLLKTHGIDKNVLVFRDDYDLKGLLANTNSKVTLVDHHVLSTKDQFLAPFVTEIIDHRPLDKTGWTYNDSAHSTIEVVGCCCTLVAQRIKDLSSPIAKDLDFFNAYPVCSDMLHSTIILDTINLSKTFNKATPHDVKILLFLESLIKPADYENYRKGKLERLTNARSDVSELTAAQLLRKDLKIVGEVLVPTFPILVQARRTGSVANDFNATKLQLSRAAWHAPQGSNEEGRGCILGGYHEGYKIIKISARLDRSGLRP
ncbi:exopolyphosphatase PRUNE1 isoform X2 [Galleria mellonella]|uniref:Exopolyphosphatase PRUNE1 isoform X2 n=1 Tax=Galleria mellonella TaxID=7137 RepID=A0A6J3C9S8_GALME|nr:exopolyphosphatase PRUNE1 isoform X2 [Galleria mellonella]